MLSEMLRPLMNMAWALSIKFGFTLLNLFAMSLEMYLCIVLQHDISLKSIIEEGFLAFWYYRIIVALT